MKNISKKGLLQVSAIGFRFFLYILTLTLVLLVSKFVFWALALPFLILYFYLLLYLVDISLLSDNILVYFSNPSFKSSVYCYPKNSVKSIKKTRIPFVYCIVFKKIHHAKSSYYFISPLRPFDDPETVLNFGKLLDSQENSLEKDDF